RVYRQARVVVEELLKMGDCAHYFAFPSRSEAHDGPYASRGREVRSVVSTHDEGSKEMFIICFNNQSLKIGAQGGTSHTTSLEMKFENNQKLVP
ncbi:hypothetical protein HAX54_050881, partial [Datura stramonium]|nr:hypothetical protein [Datura stramonium]